MGYGRRGVWGPGRDPVKGARPRGRASMFHADLRRGARGYAAGVGAATGAGAGASEAGDDAGALKGGEYDQRLARVIGELRERKLDADRPAIAAALADALARGVITPAVKAHLEKRLGL